MSERPSLLQCFTIWDYLASLEEYAEKLESERDRLGIELGNALRELQDVTEERDRLREALEILTATCERNHCVIAMGSTHDKYQFSYSCAAVHNPVKRARAALKEVGDEAGS